MANIKQALNSAKCQFSDITAMLDAEVLLADALNVPRSYLHTTQSASYLLKKQPIFLILLKKGEGQPIPI